MPSVFTRIIKREIPCYQIAETEDFFAFLDISPLKQGHTLVVPKKEVDYLFDLDEKTYSGLFLFAKNVAECIHSCIPCERVGLSVVGLEVPHAHIHLIPIDGPGDTDFCNLRVQMSSDEFKSVAGKISREYISRFSS